MHPCSSRCQGLFPATHDPQVASDKAKRLCPREGTDWCGVPFQCAGCPATYVSQTGRCLDQQLNKHRQAVESGQAATSALAEHAWGTHHPVDWDNVEVLDHQPHLHQRLILESIHIRSHSRPLNRDKGSMPQPYNSLFSK